MAPLDTTYEDDLQDWSTTSHPESAFDQLIALGWQINANQYQAVHLAARYDTELAWFHEGLKSAAHGISTELQIHGSTAREWIRVGHALPYLPLIDDVFRANEISYAKARILTRWAAEDNEQDLLDLAHEHTANRLTTAIAKHLDHNSPESDEARDKRHHDARNLTSYTNGDGMTVIRIVLPPAIAKIILAAIHTLLQRIAKTPASPATNDPENADSTTTNAASADATDQQRVADGFEPATQSDRKASADAPNQPPRSFPQTLNELRQRWQPEPEDDWDIPTLGQQQADAFVALFLGLDIDLTTEIVIHIRGDGNTFDDGTPITNNAIARQLDDSYIRLLIHDIDGKPIDATNKRRHPTTRQKRVVNETHNHQCVDCGSTDLLEHDHNPPYEQTKHTITTQLETRCAPCHRARHRTTQNTPHDRAA